MEDLCNCEKCRQRRVMQTFEKFPKIPRLNRQIVITEKIDGTNAQVLIGLDGQVRAGSRKRFITPEDDNFGFAAWVEENEAELVEALGPGRHFGEWWGKGIQRGYNLDHRRFSLFNVRRWRDGADFPWEINPWIAEYEKRQWVPSCCHVVPILHIGDFDTRNINFVLESLTRMGSAAVPGFFRPEGIVIYHTAGNQSFKVTLENDLLCT